MGIRSALERWNLILSSDAFPWWSQGLETVSLQHAEAGLPNEVVGFYSGRSESSDVKNDNIVSTVQFHTLRSTSSPTCFMAKPDALVALVYQLESEHRIIVATFHSHPLGQPTYSQRDAVFLGQWATSHVMAYRRHGTWGLVFGVSTDDDAGQGTLRQ